MLTGGVTRAGHALSITQPAVSRLIKALESELKIDLFVRQGTHLVPTDDGRDLYREVERSFAGVDRIRDAARALRLSKAGYLHVGTMPNLAMVCLPKAISEMLARYPDLVISVHPDSSVNLVQMVLHGQLDVAYAVPPEDSHGFELTDVQTTTAICVMPKGHGLAEKKVISVGDLHDEDFISLGSNSRQRMQLNDAMLRAGVHPNIRLETVHSSSVVSHVSLGVGMAVIDPIAVMGPAVHSVVIRPFTPRISMPIAAVCRASQSPMRFAGEFTSILTRVIANELIAIERLIKPRGVKR